MHFTLFFISTTLFVLTTVTFVHSAPSTSPPLDHQTLLNNAREAQRLNAQFQADDSNGSGSCTNGETGCSQNSIAVCKENKWDNSHGLCSDPLHCFALPSVHANGTFITCTSKRSAQSLIKAAGASGGISGSDTESSPDPEPSSHTSSGGVTPDTITSADAIAPTSAAHHGSVVTVTVTITQPGTATLPPVTQTLSPQEASSFLSSALDQGGPATTATSDGLDEPSDTLTSAVSATDTDSDIIPTITPSPNCSNGKPSKVFSSTIPGASATNIPPPASRHVSATPVEITNTSGSPTGHASASGGDSGY